MFPAEDGKWEPYKVRPVRKPAAAAPPVATNGTDVEMGGTDAPPKAEVNDDDEPEYEEDLESDEGAVYPLTGTFLNIPRRPASTV
jgi:actin-related protein 9